MKNIEISLTPAQADFIETALNEYVGKLLTRASRGRDQGSTVFAKMQEQRAEIGKGILEEIQTAQR